MNDYGQKVRNVMVKLKQEREKEVKYMAANEGERREGDEQSNNIPATSTGPEPDGPTACSGHLISIFP